MIVRLAALSVGLFADAVLSLFGSLNNLNVALNIVTIAIAIAVAVPIARTRGKDATISDLRSALEARTERLDETAAQLAGASARADEEHDERIECEKKIAGLEGELRRTERYAAPEAFEKIITELAATRIATTTAMSAHDELVMQNTALVAQVVKSLEHVAADIEAMTGRMHPETLAKMAADLGRLADRLGAGHDRPAQV